MTDSHELLAELAQEELNPVQGSTRYQYMGMWDGLHCKAGEPVCDPEDLELYHERQRQLGLPGVWRKSNRRANGTQRDIDYMILEW